MEQQDLNINLLAILLAVVANFILGFLWYTPLFGKAWAKELRFDMSVKPPASVMVRGMAIMVIGNFLLAYVFAHNIAAWTYVPGMDSMSPVVKILNASVFTWLGFYLPGDLSRVAWEQASWKLFWINTGYHFLMLLVAATILTLMR
jgi:hypothetical protein